MQGWVLAVNPLPKVPRSGLSCSAHNSGTWPATQLPANQSQLFQDVDQVIFGGLLSEPPKVTDSFCGESSAAQLYYTLHQLYQWSWERERVAVENNILLIQK